MAPPTPDALIIGCGYLGRRVAARWLAAGRRVAALTRRNAPALAALGVEPVTGDVLDPATLRTIPAARTVLYAVAPDRASGKTMHDVAVHGLRHVLGTIPPPERFVYVSSTGVYGQTDGGWVDEAAATDPPDESGRAVLEAERLLRDRLPAAVVLRFAGIYGPGRVIGRQALLDRLPIPGDPDRWLNLVHADDGAAAVVAAADRAAPGHTYNIADDHPVTRRDYYTLLAGLLGTPPPRFDHRPGPPGPHRRVANRLARDRLGWAPAYPGCREGLPASI